MKLWTKFALALGAALCAAVCAMAAETEPANAEPHKPHVLVVSGHPDSDTSIANKTIMTELEKALPGVELLYLDKAYPDFKIDADKERQRVSRADIIVMCSPKIGQI